MPSAASATDGSLPRRTGRDRTDGPVQAVVDGDDDRRVPVAGLVRHVRRAVRSNLDVPVQTAAARQVVDGNSRPEGRTAVGARGARSIRDVLRAVVQLAGEGARRRDAARRVRTPAQGLVVDAGVEAAALAGRQVSPALPVTQLKLPAPRRSSSCDSMVCPCACPSPGSGRGSQCCRPGSRWPRWRSCPRTSPWWWSRCR